MPGARGFRPHNQYSCAMDRSLRPFVSWEIFGEFRRSEMADDSPPWRLGTASRRARHQPDQDAARVVRCYSMASKVSPDATNGTLAGVFLPAPHRESRLEEVAHRAGKQEADRNHSAI